jgi:uncharacterized membrane protein YdcZ (DUF606 family)
MPLPAGPMTVTESGGEEGALLAALCVYGTGLVALLIAVPFTRLTGFTLSEAAHAPWWA